MTGTRSSRSGKPSSRQSNANVSLFALQPRRQHTGQGTKGLGPAARSRLGRDAATAHPGVDVPRRYNAAVDFVDRHLVEGRGAKIAFIHDRGQTTYQELAERVARAGNALHSLGIRQEERVAICVTDTIDFPTAFWGAIKIGAVPVPMNTSLSAEEYGYILRDARVRCLVVSSEIYARMQPAIESSQALETVLVAGVGDAHGKIGLEEALAKQRADLEAAPTTCDDIAFWLYSSGSTGAPKAAMHLQSSLVQTAALFGRGVLGIQESDVVFSSEKMFFAYGLGNSLTFPLHVGASAVLAPAQATSTSVRAVLRQHQPTLLMGVPSLFVSILADPDLDPERDANALRLCVSAGEALPAYVGERWQARFGVDIVDGLGSTEMLHIFLSNRPGDVGYGTAGKAVPGYELRIVDDAGQDVPRGVVGELLVKGPSSAAGYWNQRQKTMATFQGTWTRTGDKCFVDSQGYFHFCGRSDDLLKVEGMWVSPLEVEACLMAHEHVAEAAVVGSRDGDALMSPRAFVVLRPDAPPSHELEADLRGWVRARLLPHKCPRWFHFTKALPKTATGKIQRFKLR